MATRTARIDSSPVSDLKRSGQRVGRVLAAALLLAACRTSSTKAPVPIAATPTDTAPVVRRPGDAGTSIVAVATSPLQLLPDTTIAVGSVAGINALLAVVEVDALVGKYRSYYDQAAAVVTSSAGFNLLDPAQWREVGVNPDGMMGGAVLDMRSETYAGFITLSDPTRFRAFLDKLGGERRLRPVIEDRGLVLKSEPDSRSALVLRDGFAFFVNTDRPNDAPYDFARLLATIDPARGLTATPRYQRALASPEPARPLTAYVDLWAIAQAEQASREARQGNPEPSWAEQELDRAVQSGAPAEEQARLRQQVDEQRGFERTYQQGRQREFELLKRWLAPVEPVVFEFTANRTGVEGKIRAKMPETAPLRAVLQNAARPSPVLGALGERSVLQFGGSIDVLAAIVAFEEIARANGEDPERMYRELNANMGINFKTAVMSVLAGTGGFALTVSDAVMRGEPQGDSKDLGFALALAVKNVPAAQALVAEAVQKAPGKAGKDAKTGAHTLAIPGYRTVYATVTAGQIVVTTDPGVIRRLGSASAANYTAGGLTAAVVPTIAAQQVSMQGMFDVMLPMFLLRSRSSFYDMAAPSFEPYAAFPDVTPAQIDKVPRSRAFKAKLRAWEGVQAKIRKEEQGQERRQTKSLVALAECFGVMAGNLREEPDGLVLAGGQFFGKGGLTRAIDVAVEQFATARTGPDPVWELYTQRSVLDEELRKLRVIDVATALNVPTPLQ